MAERPRLQARRRTVFGKKVRRLRREGKLPAILYGPTVPDPIPLELDYRSTAKIVSAAGPSTLLDLYVEDDDQTYPVIIRERQRDILTGKLLHVDFQAVSLTETVEAEVSVVLQGEAPAARMGATIVQQLETLTVEALPEKLPEQIVIDLSRLAEPGDTITVADLVLPPEVKVLHPADEVIVAAVEAEEEAGEGEAEEGEAEAAEE